MDDGNGNEISFNKDKSNDYMMEYFGIEYAPRSCGYFCCGDCLLKPTVDGYKSCNNCIDLGGC